VRNIILFIRNWFNLICFFGLQILCVVMLNQYSKTHEAFFASISNEIIGRVNKQYDNIASYFYLQQVNKQLVEENKKLRNSLKSNFIASDNSLQNIIDTITTSDSIKYYRKYTYLPARVVGNSVSLQANYLTLERGGKQGVSKDMSVIGPQGIVGVVVSVSENYCKVMSLLHRSSKVSAMLMKNNNSGDIEWDGIDPSFVLMKKVSKSSFVKKSDTVVTSSYSANYPPNIMIGTVQDIMTDPSSNFYTLRLKTSTNFFTLQYVYIINNSRYTEQRNIENMKLKFNENE